MLHGRAANFKILFKKRLSDKEIYTYEFIKYISNYGAWLLADSNKNNFQRFVTDFSRCN
jgi:hypothetical protein